MINEVIIIKYNGEKDKMNIDYKINNNLIKIRKQYIKDLNKILFPIIDKNIELFSKKEILNKIKIREYNPISYCMQTYNKWVKDYNEISTLNLFCTTFSISADGRITDVNKENPAHKECMEDTFIICKYYLDSMIKRKKLDNEYFYNYIYNSKLMKNNSINKYCRNYTSYLISKGIERYYNKDYISCIHILIPQVETILRYICKINNIKNHKKEHNSYDNKYIKIETFKTLKDLIQILDGKNILYDFIIDFIKIYLLDYGEKGGMNYRNNIAHGIPDNMMDENCSAIIMLLLTIIK